MSVWRTKTSRWKAKSRSMRRRGANGHSAFTCCPPASAPSSRSRCCSRFSSPSRARSAYSTRWTPPWTTPTSAATCACWRSSRIRHSSSSSRTIRGRCRRPMPSTVSRCRSRVSRRSSACGWAKWSRFRDRDLPLPPPPSLFPVLMRRFFWIVFLPAGLAAQRPAVSPVLPQLLQRVQDTTVSVWLFARPGVPLDALSDRVTASGARVRVHSRWLNAISADVPSAALRMLLQDRDLRRVQPLGRFRVPADRRRALEVLRSPTGGADTCPAGGDPVYGPSDMPYRRLHLRPLSDRGHRGAGVRVGILDTGFDTQNPAFTTVTVTAQHDFVFNDNVVRDEPGKDVAGAQFHGTAVWSLFAGDVPGRLRGIAPDATYLLAKTEDVRTETRVEEDNYVAALEWADSIGVDIVSSSLAYLIFDNGFSYAPSDLTGDIAVTTVAVDAAARRGIIVVTAAGNEGPGFRTVWTPGDADSALTIGAEDSLGGIAFFSSRGPTADGRLKPDFTAPGVAVCVVTGPGALLREAGTSFATPLTAAGVTRSEEHTSELQSPVHL